MKSKKKITRYQKINITKIALPVHSMITVRVQLLLSHIKKHKISTTLKKKKNSYVAQH